MIGSKKQCRYCKRFRYGEIIVIDTSNGDKNTYDGVCLSRWVENKTIPVNQFDDCIWFEPRAGVVL